MQLPIVDFLERLDRHLRKFDKEIYPPILRAELLGYYQQFLTLGKRIDDFQDIEKDLADYRKYLDQQVAESLGMHS